MVLFAGNILVDALAVATALLAVIIAYFKWTYQYWKRRNVPYLQPSIPFGNFMNFLSSKQSFFDLTLEWYKEVKSRDLKYCGLYTMARPGLLVMNLDLVKNVMTKDFNYFMDRGTYVNENNDPLGNHLFSLSGKKWRNLRIKLTPTFTSGKLKGMFHILTNCGVVLEKYFEDNLQTTKDPVDIKDVFGRFTTDIIGSCAFGLEFNTFNDKDSPFRKYGQKFFNPGKLQNLAVALAHNFPFVGKIFDVRAVDKDITNFFMKVVKDTVTYREKNNYSRADFLQLLIDIKNDKAQQNGDKGDGNTLTIEELAAQCFVFFVAGFETSSTTATFALYELANHQDVQDRVREEIRVVLAKHGNQITYDSINEMTYMKQVIDETLRKYPPLPFLTRRCGDDYKVPGDDLFIEKGTTVIIPVVGYHYDDAYYKNPDAFDPDRFSELNKKTRHPYAHIPFGEGPRVCIGERFGVMQTKVGLTSILKNFKVTLNKRTQEPLKMSLESFIPTAVGDIWLNVENIKE